MNDANYINPVNTVSGADGRTASAGIQKKYNLLHICYWFALCSLNGFSAIFLQSKGLSASLIGTATGGACMLTVLLGPLLSSLTSKFNTISLQKYMAIGMLVSAGMYLSMTWFDMPAILLMIIYMLNMGLALSLVPFLSTLSMEYIQRGLQVNFGLSRGLGSLAYASSAVIMSALVTRFSPSILSAGFGLFSALFLLILMQTPAVYGRKASGADTREKTSALAVLKKYKTFFWILAGFALPFAGASALSTYLIRIIEMHGGNESLYGIAVFCMAASELPVMAAAPKLMKKTGTLPLIAAGGVFYILRNLLITASPNMIVLIVGMLFQGLSYGLLTAVVTYYIGETLSSSEQVMGQSLLAMATTGVASMTGNIIGGIMIDFFGLRVLFVMIDILTIAGAVILVRCGRSGMKSGRKPAVSHPGMTIGRMRI